MKTTDIKQKVAAKVEKAKAKIATKCGKTAKCAALLFGLAVVLSGCVNCYTRCPGTNGKIKGIYQSAKTAAVFSYVVSFPQVMSDSPKDYRLDLMNIITVPAGIVVFCDAVAEFVVDTICLPFDWPISEYRKGTKQ